MRNALRKSLLAIMIGNTVITAVIWIVLQVGSGKPMFSLDFPQWMPPCVRVQAHRRPDGRPTLTVAHWWSICTTCPKLQPQLAMLQTDASTAIRFLGVAMENVNWRSRTAHGHGWTARIPVSYMVVAFAIYPAWFFLRRPGRRARRRRLAGECVSCGYSLKGLIQPRCPECGMVFDWKEKNKLKPM